MEAGKVVHGADIPEYEDEDAIIVNTCERKSVQWRHKGESETKWLVMDSSSKKEIAIRKKEWE